MTGAWSLVCSQLRGVRRTLAFPITTAFASTNADVLTVHKDLNCGCCSLWANAYEKAGNRVEIVEVRDLVSFKQKLGVPLDIQGCDTVVYHRKFLEGHVLLEATRMLESRTYLSGLVVPGTPAVSLGIGDDPSAS